jgi:TolB-like protein/tetratricopeptide (TPR) repeat protein
VPQPSPDIIRAQLGRLLSSNSLAGSGRLRRFLEFVVQQTLDFPDEPLKEIIIGRELYTSHGDFDPRLSAVVRVDATRLRVKLREYYASEGAADSLIIELPKGAYTPVFQSASVRQDPPTEGGLKQTGSSIAVLPFSNLSPQPVDYFSDGLTEEIIHALSSVGGMRVVARTSCFALKHRNADVREIGRALNVDLVLEGSVRLSGDELRVTVQLVNTGNGYQVWSRRYDRNVNDVFAVQDDIAREVAGMLRVRTSGHPGIAPAGRPANFEAFAWYLRGRHHLNQQTRESFHKAIECFDHALVRSPEYPAALSGIAIAWLYLGMFAMDHPLEVMPKARAAAERALEINERNGEALSAAASVKGMYEWDWTGAEELFRKALEVEPGSELSRHLYTMFAILPMARMEEALAMVDEAMRIDPLSLLVSASRGAVLLVSRRLSEAEAEYRKTLELDPNFWRAVLGLGRVYEAQGRSEDAIACMERATLISDRVPSAIGALGHAYALAGRRQDAHKLLEELEQLAKRRYVSPYGRVLIYLGLGDERVFEWLDRSCEDRAGWLMYLATDPRFDPLRSDDRFRRLLDKMHMPVIGAQPACVSVSS